MLFKIIYFFLFTSSVLSRHLPQFADLDEEEQHLFRAAYETPAYDHDEYQNEVDLPAGKLDLLKDGLWAVKAKLKELKAFNKALCASLLTTKLKVKELVANSVALKKHHHIEKEKIKPIYNYQVPSYSQYSPQAPSYAEYSPHPQAPAYNPPAPSYPQYTQQPQYAPEYAEPQFTPPHYTHDPYYGH